MGALVGWTQAASSLTYAIVSLREDLWPEKVKVIEEVKVSLILSGQEIGQTVIEKGKEMTLKKIEKDLLILDFNPAEVKVPYLKTDLMDRARALYEGAAEKKKEYNAKADDVKTPLQAENKKPQETPQTQKLQEESEATADAEEQETEDGEVTFKNKFLKDCKARFVKVEGKKVRSYPIESLADKEYLAIYFSASWCGPCREFTPKLVEMYNNLSEKQRKKFELIFISSDQGEEGMEEYMLKYNMPWLAMRRDDADHPKKNPFHHLDPGAIPCLFLLDRNGEVIDGGRGKYTEVLKKIPTFLK
jgi:thiol-disulfide isomerase/thioredoxin